MRRIAVLLVLAALGCGITSTSTTPDHSTLDMPKTCSCAGNMACCGHDSEGRLCCTPESCTCKQVTSR